MNRFIILVTVHNSVQWIGKCLNSVVIQTYKNYKLIVVDDNSTDGTWDVIQQYDCIKYRNKEQLFHSLINMVNVIPLVSDDPEDIIVSLDGDDWLSDDGVLAHLDEQYTNDVWLTYGQYEPLSGTYSHPCQPIDARTYRKSREWRVSHLKTFRKKLWDRIDQRDFLDDDGYYLMTCGDLAMMYPMIEMAGNDHIKFIDRVLLIYNDSNPASHTRLIPQVSLRIAEYLQNKPMYDPID